MMKRTLVLLILALTATSLFAQETMRYVVSTRTSPREGRFRVMSNATTIARANVRTFANVNGFAANLTAEEVAELKRSGNVLSVMPVVERSIFEETPEEPIAPTGIRYGTEQHMPWGITTIGAPDVWKISKGSRDVHVAVIDTGIDFTHPDLIHAYQGGYNVFKPAEPPMDDHRHGTHVAGTIAAADNSFGVVGVAPNVKIWGVKVLDDDGKGTDETLTAGLDWVISKSKEVGGRWVVNLSLGSRFGSDLEKVAIERALQANIVIVAAAGNTALPNLNYPAGYQGVIAVGATDSTNSVAKFSTFGIGLSVVAPGVSVPSTYRGGYSSSADVTRDDVSIDVIGITGSPYATLSGRLVDCGLGHPEDIPSSVRGRIALMKRGVVPFREKARNAKEAGAIAVVIYNDPELPNDITNWTMVYKNCDINGCTMPPEWVDYEFPLTVGATGEFATKLQEWVGKNVTVGFRPEDYGPMSGTSMATPHVAGSAAMLLSLAPSLNVAQVLMALEKTATDVDEKGWDLHTAWGLINLPAAAKYVAPGAFGMPAPPAPPPSKRRGTRS
jgi:serine protease